MKMRRPAAALAVACACIMPAQGYAQPSRSYGPSEPAPAPSARPAAPGADQRLAEMPPSEPGGTLRDGMLESWDMGGNAQFGLGRFRVPELARRRSNMERERNPAALERQNSAIAGAGLRVRF